MRVCLFSLLPFEDTKRSQPSETWEPERGLSPDPYGAGTLNLDFLSSKTVRNMFLLFLSGSVYGIFVIEAEWAKTGSVVL